MYDYNRDNSNGLTDYDETDENLSDRNYSHRNKLFTSIGNDFGNDNSKDLLFDINKLRFNTPKTQARLNSPLPPKSSNHLYYSDTDIPKIKKDKLFVKTIENRLIARQNISNATDNRELINVIEEKPDEVFADPETYATVDVSFLSSKPHDVFDRQEYYFSNLNGPDSTKMVMKHGALVEKKLLSWTDVMNKYYVEVQQNRSARNKVKYIKEETEYTVVLKTECNNEDILMFTTSNHIHNLALNVVSEKKTGNVH